MGAFLTLTRGHNGGRLPGHIRALRADHCAATVSQRSLPPQGHHERAAASSANRHVIFGGLLLYVLGRASRRLKMIFPPGSAASCRMGYSQCEFPAGPCNEVTRLQMAAAQIQFQSGTQPRSWDTSCALAAATTEP
jgi:hypothetical protein